MPDEQRSPTAVMEPPGPPAPPAPPATGAEPPERIPWWQRIIVTLFVAFLILILLGAVAYNFGSMWFPSTETRVAYQAAVEAGDVSTPRERQFHIPIPGCVCHSDDPVTVIEHEDRRIRECSSCHGGR